MKISIINNNFGKVSSILIVLGTVIIGYAGVNITYNKIAIDVLSRYVDYFHSRKLVLWINLAFLLVLIVGFFLFNRKNSTISTSKARILFTTLVFSLQFFLTSFLVDLVDYGKDFAYDPNSGVSWILILPINLIFLFTVGVFFDKKESSFTSTVR